MPGARPNSSGALPASSVVEITSSLAELSANLKLLEGINAELQRTVFASTVPDYEVVAIDATDIRKLAIRLMRSLSLPRGELKAGPEPPKPAASADHLKAATIALDANVRMFLDDPVVTKPGTVDAGKLSNVGANLELLANRSDDVRKEAEDLSSKAGKTTMRIKSRLRPSSSMQLTLECTAWSISDLLNRPAETKGQGSVDIGVRVQIRRHQLSGEVIVSIDDCVDGASYEKAVTDNVQYVAIIKDFVSYEVTGKVFAYRVNYEIGFTRNGQIAKRYSKPVSFYYVDEAGDGGFELLKGPVEFGLLPDWAKERAQKH